MVTSFHPGVRFRVLAALVAPVLLLSAGCGGSDESSATTTTADAAANTDAGGSSTTVDEVATAWGVTASEWASDVGGEHDVDCPAGGIAGKLWGSDIYTTDSSVCTAGVHAGVIDLQDGGTVTITILEGQDEYFASTSNGVESVEYGPYSGSFSVVGADAIDASTDIGWSRRANFYSSRTDESITVVCASDGEFAKVWGTGPYTADSSICTAAVHSGLIDIADGGEVTFRVIDGRDSYDGSTANGVTTSEYGEYGESFEFI